MKNLISNIKKSVLLILLFVNTLSYAGKITLTENDNIKRTALTLKNVKEGNLLSIKDESGLILYKELIEKAGLYSKGFDLTQLPNGNYFFELEKDMEIKTIPFIVKSNNVIFKKAQERTIHKPHTKIKGNAIYVTKLALHFQPLHIEIFLDTPYGYESLYTEKIRNKKVIEKIYKLSEKGSYKIVYNTENRVFTKYFNYK